MVYLAVFEKADDGSFWARVPDLSGCYFCGQILQEAKASIKEEIGLHIEGLLEEGLTVPPPNLISAELIHI